MKVKGILIGLGVIGILFLFDTSCKKNTDCVANIQTLDSTGIGISGVDVFLYASVKTTMNGTVTADLKASAVTDASGRVSFTFKLPAIYDIKATKVAGTSTMTGISIIKLEEGKTVEKVFTVR